VTTFTKDDLAAKQTLAKWIQRHKLNNVKAADVLGVTPTTVGRWLSVDRELGRRIPLAKWLPVVLAQAERELKK